MVNYCINFSDLLNIIMNNFIPSLYSPPVVTLHIEKMYDNMLWCSKMAKRIIYKKNKIKFIK